MMQGGTTGRLDASHAFLLRFAGLWLGSAAPNLASSWRKALAEGLEVGGRGV